MRLQQAIAGKYHEVSRAEPNKHPTKKTSNEAVGQLGQLRKMLWAVEGS